MPVVSDLTGAQAVADTGQSRETKPDPKTQHQDT
nr:MAG TPA: hypothetical protein [Caudoviricetes sp.]